MNHGSPERSGGFEPKVDKVQTPATIPDTSPTTNSLPQTSRRDARRCPVVDVAQAPTQPQEGYPLPQLRRRDDQPSLQASMSVVAEEPGDMDIPSSSTETPAQKYQKMQELFEEFKTRKFKTDYTSPRTEGGDIKREGKRPHNQEDPEMSHVEMSFTEPQREVIGSVTTSLNLMANNRKVGGQPDEDGKDFSTRIVETFDTTEPHQKKAFMDAFSTATCDLITEYAERRPHMIPALEAMFAYAGLDGLELVSIEALEAFTQIQHDRNPRAVPFTNKEFSGEHNSTEPGKKYEVWCTAEGFAKTLYRESVKAAVQILAHPDNQPNKFLFPMPAFYAPFLAATVAERITRLKTQAEAKYGENNPIS